MSSNVFMNNQLERIADYIDAGKAGGGSLTVNLSGVGDMTGATAGQAGAHGLVPAPAAGDENKVLSGAGNWIDAGSGGELGELEDVTITSPTSGESLKYDGAKWVNGNVTAKLPDFIEETSGNIVTVEAAERPAKNLKVAINPVQSGSGDPSPDNIRPISGWTECNVVVSPTTDAEDGTTYTITFPSEAGTVYGGTLDVVNGTLTVDKTKIRLNDYLDDITSVGPGSKRYFRINGIVFPEYYRLCEKIKNAPVYSTTYDIGIGMGTPSGTSGYRLSVRPPQVNGMTVEEFRGYINGMGDVFVVVSKTPITYQLTPTEVQMLLGTNNIWADTGEVKELKYIPQTYNDLLEEVTGGGYDITTNGTPVETGITWDGYPVKCFCVRYYNLSLNTNTQDISLAEYGFSDTINGLFKVDCIVQNGDNMLNVTPHVHYDGHGNLRGRYDTSENFSYGTGYIFIYYY